MDRFPQKELYVLILDPYELVNLVGNPGYAQIQARLVRELKQLRSPRQRQIRDRK